jgi:hypothetical protein
MSKIKIKVIIDADSVDSFMCLFMRLYNGVKIKASKIPTIIAIKIGLSKKYDKTKSPAITTVDVIFLKYSSAIFPLLTVEITFSNL